MAKRVLSHQRRVSIDDGRVDWKRAAKSFRRILRVHGEEFKRLADARTYRDLYLEDGVEPPNDLL